MNLPRFLPYKIGDEVSIIENAFNISGLQKERHQKVWLQRFEMITS